tara:strand:+ start:198 stop:668 length:471 start_codon:yes stop_codon:yes gene_type:complete
VESKIKKVKGKGVSAYMTPDTQAGHFRQARQAREAETIEDYVELIADLIDESGEARAVDISKRIGVTSATVNKMITRLQQLDYVKAQPYRSIFLTERGREIAEKCRKRHHIIVRFLIELGVSDETAWADAEGIEHHCSEETLKAFQIYTKNQIRRG